MGLTGADAELHLLADGGAGQGTAGAAHGDEVPVGVAGVVLS